MSITEAAAADTTRTEARNDRRPALASFVEAKEATVAIATVAVVGHHERQRRSQQRGGSAQARLPAVAVSQRVEHEVRAKHRADGEQREQQAAAERWRAEPSRRCVM